jgi:large subunit ribosomal protein L23
MALFGKKEKSLAKKKASVKKVEEARVNTSLAYDVLVKPRVTEKAHNALELNKYVFEVYASATKELVKKAIEGAYGVKVARVNIVNIPPKKRYFGRSVGMKSGIKKAVVTLKEGETIEIFQGA